MKIVHIIDSEGIYGAEKVLLTLIEEQTNNGHNAILVSIKNKNEPSRDIAVYAEKKGFPVYEISSIYGPSPVLAFKIIAIARDCNADLLHSHGYKSNILLALIPKFYRKIPLVTTIHGWTSTSKYSKLHIYSLLESFLFRFMQAIVVVSDNQLQDRRILRYLNRHIIIQKIHNSISIINEESQTHNNRIIPESDLFTIGSIGRLSVEKGYSGLVRVVISLIKELSLPVRLVIIGGGDLHQELKHEIRKVALEDKILLTGYLDNAYSYISSFDLYVNNSLTEGFPITIIEAMSVGVPIIATRVGSIPVIIQDDVTGILIDPGNESELRNAIQHLYIDNDKRKILSKKAKIYAGKEFGSNKMHDEYLELYKKILDR